MADTRPLLLDREITIAANVGDNDRALELSIEQRNFYEMFCDDVAELREWLRRRAEKGAYRG